MERNMKARVVLGTFLAVLFYQISVLVGTDWRKEDAIGSVLEEVAKFVMMHSCKVPGLRLMCSQSPEGYPLSELSYLDSVFGCFFYSVGFVFFLWMLTPLPEITTHLILVVHLTPRRNEIIVADEGEEMEVPVVWHPGGGEGPIFPQ